MNMKHNDPNMAGILAKDFTKVLNFCLTNNVAFHMQHSAHFNEDLAIPALTNTMMGLSKVTCEQAGVNTEDIGLLPKSFNTKGNYELLEFVLHTKDGKTIFYNAYLPCPHGDEPCIECRAIGLRCKEKMKKFIENLHC